MWKLLTNIFKNRGKSYYFCEEKIMKRLLITTELMIRKICLSTQVLLPPNGLTNFPYIQHTGLSLKKSTLDRNLIFCFIMVCAQKIPLRVFLIPFEFSIYSIISLWVVNKLILDREVREQQLHVDGFNCTKMP